MTFVGASIDQLQIDVNAQAVRANDALDKLANKLDRLQDSLGRLNVSNLTSLANGVQRFGTAMQTMNTVKTADFTRLAKNIEKLSVIDADRLNQASTSIHHFVNSLGNLKNLQVSDTANQIAQLAKGIAQLGYKSSTQAIANIPKLAVAMRQLMQILSNAPKVSQNLIDMTNALANLSRTGASSGRAANSSGRGLNTYTSATSRATKGTFSLASAIGKLYATYWMLFRVFGKIKEAINISSSLTEVQNVVDVTFGKYASLVDKMSESSIVDFGMSELTVKQISSRFQAMGTAMGFAQGKMADMSINLTKLAADMASFYNVEQADVAEDLESIFTGQTRPLRTYGLDLTQATLQEWAMKQGLDANIQSMSQAEKALLRYQYVLANTGAAQGDFTRTADTWANQVRILKQNFQALGAVIGGTFINALKPMVKALNNAMTHIIAFAKTISNALGKIFGWTYEEGGGGIANDFESAADSTDDIAGGLSDAEKAAKKLKTHLLGIDELNVVEPDTVENGSGSGGSGGAGTGGAGADGGQWVKTDSIFKNFESEIDTLEKLGNAIRDSLIKAMESIDWNAVYEKARGFGSGLANFLNGLLDYDKEGRTLFGEIGKTLANTLNTVVYSAQSFLTDFDFYQLGVNLGDGLNRFFENFDFTALADSLNRFVDGLEDALVGFLRTLDFQNIISNIDGFLSELELDTVAVIIGAFVIKGNVKKLLGIALSKNIIGGITLENVPLLFKSFAIPGTPAFDVIGNQILMWIENSIAEILPQWAQDMLGNIVLGMSMGGLAGSAIPGIGTLAGLIIGGLSGAFLTEVNGSNLLEKLLEPIFNFDRTTEIFNRMKKHFQEGGWNIVLGIGEGILGALSFLTEPITGLFDFFINTFCDIFGIHSPAESTKPLGENIFLGILEGFVNSFDLFTETFTQFWEGYVVPWFTAEKWLELYDTIKTSLETKWGEVEEWWSGTAIVSWWEEDVKPWFKLEKWLELLDTIKTSFKTKWDETAGQWAIDVKLWWEKHVAPWFTKERWLKLGENLKNGIYDGFKGIANKVVGILNNVISALESMINNAISGLNNLLSKISSSKLGEFVGFNFHIGNVSFGRIPAFEIGGFPEDGLFMANSTELVGKFTNGKTAVANNAQIIEGIRSGVESAIVTVITPYLSDIARNTRETADKDLSVNIGDREIYRASERGRAETGYEIII